MIVIIDYNMCNVGSIQNMLKKIGIESKITSSPEDLASAEKLILPGIGAFDRGMENLDKLGLIDVLDQKVLKEKVPILGICLGMQLMTQRSEEGVKSGLGWVEAETKKIRVLPEQKLKVPHIGWNHVQISEQNRETANFLNLENDDRFYFVHSYQVCCLDPSIALTTTRFGNDFCSSFVKGNILGVQFHPEKSHKYGMKVLKGFSQHYCYA